MADNVEITAGSGTTVAADDIGGVKYQRMKISVGADGTANDASVTYPLPVTACLESGQIMVAGVAVTPKFQPISASSSGNNTIVTAVSSKKIRVLSYSLVCAGSVNVKFQSGASGTDLTGAMPFVANTGIAPGFVPVGHFETGSNTLLNLNLSAAVQVSGHCTYIEV